MLHSACSAISLANMAAGFGAPEDLDAVASAQRIYAGNGGAILLAPSVHPMFAAGAPVASVPEIQPLVTGPRAAAILGCRRHKLLKTLVVGTAYEIQVMRELLTADTVSEARTALAGCDGFTRTALGLFLTRDTLLETPEEPPIADLYWLHKICLHLGAGRASAALVMQWAQRAQLLSASAKEAKSLEDNYLRRWGAKRGFEHRRCIDSLDPELATELVAALHDDLKKFQLETWRH